MDKPPVRGYALHGFMAVTSRNYPLKKIANEKQSTRVISIEIEKVMHPCISNNST